MKETDLYEPVKEWLEQRDFQVFTEVSPFGGSRCDIVATRGAITVALEMKVSLTFELLDQCANWAKFANYVYAVVPKTNGSRGKAFALRVMKQEGIGLIEVSDLDRVGHAQALVSPALNRTIYPDLRHALIQFHQVNVAGGHAGHDHWSPYKHTIEQVQKVLRWVGKGEWLTIPQILEHVETHYKNPRATLGKVLIDFESDWCESKKVDGRLHFRFRPDLH